MGHKAHPIGLRLGIHRKWNSNWFYESKNYPKFIHLNLNIEKFFRGYLYFSGIKSLVLKTQLIKLPSNQLFIFIFYYRFRKRLKKNFYKKSLKKWKSNLEKNLNGGNYIIYKKDHKYASYLKTLLNGLYTYNVTNNFNQNFLLKKALYISSLHKIVFKFKALLFQKNFVIKNKQILKNFIYKIYLKIQIIKNFLLTLKASWIQLNILKKEKLLNIQKNFLLLHLYLKNKFFNPSFLNDSKKSLIWKKKISKVMYFFIWKKYILFKNTSIKQKITKKKRFFFFKKSLYHSKNQIKQFLSKITNTKINLIFINTLSFVKFFYLINNAKKEKFNILKIQKIMLNKFKYNAIFIKDFVHLSFISIILKNTTCLVKFIGEQFKRLPKNRKQLKLLNFINQTIKIFCQQRKEFIGFRLQIHGRLNRRNRTHKWVFQKGSLPIQTYDTRIEYGFSEGLTRSGLIGIKLWFFYKKVFKHTLKKKIMQYLFYSKYKKYLNIKNVTTKPTKI